VGWVTRVRHYRGLSQAEARLRSLLGTWRFQALDSLMPREAVPA